MIKVLFYNNVDGFQYEAGESSTRGEENIPWIICPWEGQYAAKVVNLKKSDIKVELYEGCNEEYEVYVEDSLLNDIPNFPTPLLTKDKIQRLSEKK